jgi:hypothetical protein
MSSNRFSIGHKCSSVASDIAAAVIVVHVARVIRQALAQFVGYDFGLNRERPRPMNVFKHSLLFGSRRRLGFTAAALFNSFFARNILTDL